MQGVEKTWEYSQIGWQCNKTHPVQLQVCQWKYNYFETFCSLRKTVIQEHWTDTSFYSCIIRKNVAVYTSPRIDAGLVHLNMNSRFTSIFYNLSSTKPNSTTDRMVFIYRDFGRDLICRITRFHNKNDKSLSLISSLYLTTILINSLQEPITNIMSQVPLRNIRNFKQTKWTYAFRD